MMDRDTVFEVVAFLKATGIRTLDITGGAPELNPDFRTLVTAARDIGVHVMDRCNLTILEQPGQEDLAQFLSDHEVEVVASLPCYLEENVDRQRGKGVFETSIRCLQRLNRYGYGRPGSGLALNLVYNPQGPVLPPAQEKLEQDYRRHLSEHYGIVFDRLFVLANMPIQRFGSTLISKGQFAQYIDLLKNAYQPQNLESVMCRTLLSVDWRGYVYDCDFNQMLGLGLEWKGKPRVHLRELIGAHLNDNPIVVKDHCYGCTAGQGSSCGGALGA
jgi:radical SAM/Cys-rich protein